MDPPEETPKPPPLAPLRPRALPAEELLTTPGGSVFWDPIMWFLLRNPRFTALEMNLRLGAAMQERPKRV